MKVGRYLPNSTTGCFVLSIVLQVTIKDLGSTPETKKIRLSLKKSHPNNLNSAIRTNLCITFDCSIPFSDALIVDSFKKKLDEFLEKIPNEPSVAGRQRVTNTNSLICQIPLYKRMNPNAEQQWRSRWDS